MPTPQSASQITQNILNQLYVLDPSISAEEGTPERNIIETVAQVIAAAQVDLSVLAQQNNISALTGASLDSYASTLGFARQQATASTGIILFSVNAANTVDTVIPQGTQVAAPATNPSLPNITFVTTQTVTLAAGTTSVSAPAQCSIPGSIGNVAANTITVFGNLQSIIGITNITNPNAFTGGNDVETDAQLQTRLNNSLFRNMAGTESQFMALALTGTGVSKVVVLGPISRYQEYVQVPYVDDTTQNTNGGTDYNYDPSPVNFLHKRTTAASTIPYSKYTYNINYFLTDGTATQTSNYFIPNVDYVFNRYAINPTSSPRAQLTSAVAAHQPNVTILNPYDPVNNTTGNPALSQGNILLLEHQYISEHSRNDIPSGVMNAIDIYTDGSNPQTVTSQEVFPPSGNAIQNTNPNSWTYQSVRSVSDGVLNQTTTVTSATANFTSADVGKPISATGIPFGSTIVTVSNSTTVIISSPATVTSTGVSITIADSVSFIRNLTGDRCRITNYILPLFWQPVLDVPQTIRIGNSNEGNTIYTMYKANYVSYNSDGSINQYYYDSALTMPANYFACTEVTGYGGTIRARNGIEFRSNVNAYAPGDTTNPTGPVTTAAGFTGEQFTCTYTYDANVAALQAIMEQNKQVTTDVLVHRAQTNYYELYLTVMYTPGSTQSVVNASILAAVSAYFSKQYFGATIQLSDILSTVANVPGVDNVRWTADVLPSGSKSWRASTTYTVGTYIRPSVDNGHIYVVTAASGDVGTTEPTWPTTPQSVVTLNNYTYQEVAARHRVQQVGQTGAPLVNGYQFYDYDFYLQDNQLPASPSANAAEIRPRSQATWVSILN